MKLRDCSIIYVCCLALLLAGAGLAAADQTVIINDYGGGSFVYGGYSYIPLRSATDFLGAALLWDSVKNQATISYSGNEIGLTVGSPYAYYGGQPHALPVAPVIVNNRTFIPVSVIRDQFGLPVIWDGQLGEVRIQGPNGWGRLIVNRHPGPHVVRVMKAHGNPPWSGGPGRRAAPPPGLQGKPGGLPPGQAKKLQGQGHDHGTVIIIDTDDNGKKNAGKGNGNSKKEDQD